MLRRTDPSKHPTKRPRFSPRAWQRFFTIFLTVGLLASLPGLSLARANPTVSLQSETLSSIGAANVNHGSNPTVAVRAPEAARHTGRRRSRNGRL